MSDIEFDLETMTIKNFKGYSAREIFILARQQWEDSFEHFKTVFPLTASFDHATMLPKYELQEPWRYE